MAEGMNNMMLFAGATYYPSGGFDDFCGVYETKMQAIAALKDARQRRFGQVEDWWHIIDRRTLKWAAHGWRYPARIQRKNRRVWKPHG